MCSPPPPRPDSSPAPLVTLKGPGAPHAQAAWVQQGPATSGTQLCAENDREQDRHGPKPSPPDALTVSGYQVPQGRGHPYHPRAGTRRPSPGTAAGSHAQAPLCTSPWGVQGRRQACGQRGASRGPESQQAPTWVQAPGPRRRLHCLRHEWGWGSNAKDSTAKPPWCRTTGFLPASGRPGALRRAQAALC